MITSELKDKLLAELITMSNKKLRFSFLLIDLAEKLDLSTDITRKILIHFNEINIIKFALTKDKVSPVTIELEVYAFELHNSGGFSD